MTRQMDIRLDDIFAALLLSLAMFRRLEVKSAPVVSELGEKFHIWQREAERIYSRVALACGAKVVFNVGFYHVAIAFGLAGPVVAIVSGLLFMGWVVFMVWSWRQATEANHLRLALGIQLRRARTPQRGAG